MNLKQIEVILESIDKANRTDEDTPAEITPDKEGWI